MGAIAAPARQLTQQVAVAAGRGFELQHGVIDPERFHRSCRIFSASGSVRLTA